MNTYAGRPTAAAAAAVAPARLPVDAQASASTPNSTARAAATATARSLNERDGLRVSSLSHRRSTPSVGARRSAVSNGVDPTGSDRAGAASTGQKLEIAPDPRRTPGDRLAGQRRAGDREVVGDLQRPEAGGTDIRHGEGLGPAAVATDHPADARGGPRHRRGAGRRARATGGWQGLGRHDGLRHTARRGDRGCGRPGLSRSKGSPKGVPSSRRRTCPELAPCRRRAGRLSWLHRAGPSATLDKSSSVVRGCYAEALWTVKVNGDSGRSMHPHRNLGDTRAQHSVVPCRPARLWKPTPADRPWAPHHARPVDP